MEDKIYKGKLVRLAIQQKDNVKAYERWNLDSEYARLADSDPSYLWSRQQMAEWIDKEEDCQVSFNIRTLADDKLIGGVGLWISDWASRNAWVGIGIGEREYWGKGYGTEAMRLIVRFGFRELNLNRISLDVFGYNERAVRSYEKVGFKVEGRMREWINRAGVRSDLIYMGLLRREWEAVEENLE
ncbi:MAG TPA: GNAT family protein [Anaerolineaceae bacterium]|mgnify:CR=1 FL=1|nr:GNAT family protein [Anaerolineaceae bacterium]HPN51087.1 GNAT family protein [Anaerolineaceae bacterium]